MKKRFSVVIIVVMLMISSTSVGVYAQTYGETDLVNFNGCVQMYSDKCVHFEKSIPEIIISKDGQELVRAAIPYSDENGGNILYDEIAGADVILEEITPLVNNASLSDENFDLIKDCGYDVSVTIDVNDPEHEYIVDEVYMTAETQEMYELIILGFAEYVVVECKDEVEHLTGKTVTEVETEDDYYVMIGDKKLTLEDFFVIYKEMCTDEEGLAEIADIEERYYAYKNGEFGGQLIIVANIECTCPVYGEYYVYHEYYDAAGNYVAQEMIDFNAVVGTVIKPAKDIEIIEEYDGLKYKFVGFYGADEEGWDFSKTVKEFTVDEEETVGICAKYVAVTEEGAVTDDVQTDKDDSPATGDDFNATTYLVLMMIAAAVAVLAVKRRKAH